MARSLLACPLLALALAGCLRLPGWETPVNIPLASDTLEPRELLDSGLFHAVDSEYQLSLQRGFDTLQAEEFCNGIELSESCRIPFSFFLIPPLSPVCGGFALWEVFIIRPAESAEVMVPPFELPTRFDFELAGMDSASLAGGTIRVLVSNRTRVRLDRVKLALDGVGTFRLGVVEPLTVQELTLPMAGMGVGSRLAGRLIMGSQGAGDSLIWVGDRDSISFNMVFDSLRVGRGRLHGLIPLSVDDTIRFALGADRRFVCDSVQFQSGRIGFTFTNRSTLTLAMAIRVPEFGFSVDISLAPETTVTTCLDLAGDCYRSLGQSTNMVSAALTLRPEFCPDTVNLDGTEYFGLAVCGTDMAAAWLAGCARDTVWSTTLRRSVTVEQPERLRLVRLTSLWLTAEARSAIGFGGIMTGRVVAVSQSGDSTEAPVLTDVPAGSPESTATGRGQADATALLANGATRLQLEARFGLVGRGVMRFPSWVAGSLALTAPARGCMLAETLDFGPWPVDLPDELRSRSGLRMAGGEIVIPMSGHFPFGMQGQLVLRQGSAAPVTFAFAIPRAQMDTIRGIAAGPTDSVVVFELGKKECDVFRGGEFSAALRLAIPNTDTITITPRDYFRINESYARIRLEVNQQ